MISTQVMFAGKCGPSVSRLASYSWRHSESPLSIISQSQLRPAGSEACLAIAASHVFMR